MTPASSISNEIIGAILSQRLTPSIRLGETELATLFGCSRTVVREALVDLSARGIVTVKPRKGWFLTEVDLHKAREIYLAREILETGLLRYLHRKPEALVPTALDEIGRHLESQADALSGRDVARRSYLLGDFHVCVANSLGNPTLAGYLRDMTVLTTLFLMRHQSPSDAEQSYREHVAVYDAMVRGDFDVAGDAMRHHLSTWERKVKLEDDVEPVSPLRAALTPRVSDAAGAGNEALGTKGKSR